ncbi:GNAT family N-acetyltransferase [Nocardiopsis sp. Huas11]|uniref:GNAT family N-acetyltransferase n=1 Tax=Nocardiopsis sp. Huas11 TaxID=2183912 RepID=UPI000EAE5138|nr:GNAT family protein [Nocardiopsis sp. Huas11]
MLTLHLETPRITFRAMQEESVPELYNLLMKLGLESLPSLDEYTEGYRKVVEDGLVEMIEIELKQTGETVGFGSIREHDPAGHVKLGIFTDSERLPVGVGAEAMMMLVNYSFATWEDLRKVYAMTTEASLKSFSSALATSPREALLSEQMYFQGRAWDLHYFSVTRSSWTAHGRPILDRIVNGKRSGRPTDSTQAPPTATRGAQ